MYADAGSPSSSSYSAYSSSPYHEAPDPWNKASELSPYHSSAMLAVCRYPLPDPFPYLAFLLKNPLPPLLLPLLLVPLPEVVLLDSFRCNLGCCKINASAILSNVRAFWTLAIIMIFSCLSRPAISSNMSARCPSLSSISGSSSFSNFQHRWRLAM